ncbi:MAG: hypothetical protein CM15mP21_5240 [Hyphomicrobiales bacterium]|nr:MAG: hypothetical protein CM15mP21_5240 [Hyphomicrobiales bacterium]
MLSANTAVMFCLLAVAQADGPVGARELDLIARLVETCRNGGEAHGKTRDVHRWHWRANCWAQKTGWKAAGAGMRALDTARCAQAYALAADFVMLNARITPEEMRLLDILAEISASIR